MKEQSIELIKSFISKKIGLDTAAIGKNSISFALNSRMVACQIADFDEYYRFLMSSSREEQELIESLIIPETWFFRGKSSFNFLEDYLHSEWSIIGANKILYALSMPCSSGEEPYSMAITMLDAGMKPKEYYIDAIDISRINLQRAKEAVYREHSFRGTDLNFRSRYFEKTKSGEYSVLPLVRENVNFFYGNLADPSFRCGIHRYQIIFCRNLLIYLTEQAKKHIFTEIDNLLEDHGILITSSAEADLFLTLGYEPIKYPEACAFRKPVRKEITESKIEGMKEQELMPFPKPILKTAKSVENPFLEKVSRMANNGHLDEAMVFCKEYIREHNVDFNGYFLLGMLQYAKGMENEAVDSLQKSLYLAPDHYESLIYLSLLEEKRGEKQQAVLLRQRAQKTYSRNRLGKE